ncbi:MAG: EF-P lysine aminoacylase EpmA [Gammaproteobacteria bacterium]
MDGWRPLATADALRRRAALLAAVRAHFAASAATEVTTPVLQAHATTEPTLANLRLAGDPARFLRTSPESALKRLVAAGAGDVYEIGPAFRAHEQGRRHSVEFTLLEWYRVGATHHALMDEVETLVRRAGYAGGFERVSYGELFEEAFGEQPHELATARLAALAARTSAVVDAAVARDRALLFDLLYVHEIEPRLAARPAVFVHAWPQELRAYARLEAGPPPTAARFELVMGGLEVANGYHEITLAAEQAACFAAENALRRERGLPAVDADADWLAALAAGLPPCAGVALGIERLHMALEGAGDIDRVLAFRAAG